MVIEPNHVGEMPRQGEIVEVIQGQAGEHYRVRWDRDDHESIFFPTAGAHIEPPEQS
jgi:hypothetical protein